MIRWCLGVMDTSTVSAVEAPVRGQIHQVGSRGSEFKVDVDKGLVGSTIFYVFYVLFRGKG